MNHIDFIGGFFEEIWTGVEKKLTQAMKSLCYFVQMMFAYKVLYMQSVN